MAMFKRYRKDKDGNELALKKKDRLICVVFHENKSCTIKKIDRKKRDYFKLCGNYYFIIPECIYLGKNNVILSFYMEGISIPLSHKNIEKENVTKDITDFITGETKKVTMTLIKGLKFDSKVLYNLLNDALVRIFMKVKHDATFWILLILVCVTCILTGIILGMNAYHYYHMGF